MRAALRILALTLSVSTLAPVMAQAADSGGNMVLIADRVYMPSANRLIAEGGVEAFQNGVRIRAARILYNATTDSISLEGPIHIEQGGSIHVLASYGELDSEFRNALLDSARVVLNQQLQLAAARMQRIDGRYNVLHKTTVSSCKVCDTSKPPLWQIRASRVVHDAEERQIYFDNAQLRVLDIPIIYFPQLRLPDPTMERATGFLIPQLTHNTQLGLGLKIPYFLTIGPHRDLTMTPYLSSRTKTLELRYRQAFSRGRINIEGAISHDEIHPDQPRAYVFADGTFDLERDYKLSFNLKAVSDDAYLYDYDYSDDDRLHSDIRLHRTLRDENTEIGLRYVQSLRDDEDNDTLPSIIAIAETERRYFPSTLGGEMRLKLELHSHYRASSLAIDGPDADPVSGPIVDGRDVNRAMGSLWWRRNWTSRAGLRTSLTGELAFDAIKTSQDLTFAGTQSQLTPSVALQMRYPMSRVTSTGVTHILEPVAQIGWSGGDPLLVANDESTRVEFDEGNLFALSRFPSSDRRERGTTAALGLYWSRYAKDGWQGRFALGQVYHRTAQTDFTQSSGLSGTESDLLIAGQITAPNGLSIMARGLYDWSNGFDKFSAHAAWSNDTLWLDGSLVWLAADTAEDRTDTMSEWVLDGRYRINTHWTALADWRYNIATSQSAEAGLGLEYRNECVKVGLSVSRNFTTSSTVQPSTDIGLTIALLGFSYRNDDQSYNRRCSN